MKLHLSHFEETEGKVIAESGCLYCCLIAKPPLLFSDSFSTPWTAQQSPLSMEFSRQEYWSGLPFPSPVDLPDPGIKPRSPAFQAESLPTEL